METTIYNQKGEKAGKITLPEDVFGLPWNSDLVHQVTVSMNSNQRSKIAKVKDRSEVSGTGKKPWRQKGTGRARHGSRRSPIWAGGGVAHGPTAEKNYKKKINKKMRVKALYVILSEKFRNGEILFVDKIVISETKTKKASEVLGSLGKISGFERLTGSKKAVAHLAQYKKEETNERSFRNLPQISLGEVRNLSPLNVLQYRYLLITNPKESIEVISKRLPTDNKQPTTDNKKAAKRKSKKK